MCDLLSSLTAFATAVKVNSAQCAVLLFFKGSIMTGLPLSLLGMLRLWIWAHNRMATAGAADSQREWWCTHRISQMGGHCTQHVGVVSVCLFYYIWACAWKADSFKFKWLLSKATSLWERAGHCNSCVYVTAIIVKNAHFSGFEFVYMLLACENKDKALLMKTIVWFSNVLVFLCFSDEGPYTKHSNPSRPPDGALAIRRQSIPGTKLNAWFVTAVMV